MCIGNKLVIKFYFSNKNAEQIRQNFNCCLTPLFPNTVSIFGQKTVTAKP